MKRFLSLSIGLAATLGANAQSQIDTITIRENRLQLPYNQYNRDIQILNREDVKKLPVTSVNELLAYVQGVDMRQRGPWGAQGDVSIDGSTFDQVLVLINGVRMSDPQTGHNMMNLPVPLTAIERIEVMRGAAARIYGVNALAGAINIVTRIPTENTIEAQAYAGSSFKTDTSTGKTYNAWGIRASASLAGKKHAHILSIGHDEGNGYRYNTAFNNNRIFYQNTIRLNSKHQLMTMGGYTENKFGASLFYAAPNDKEATEEVKTALGSLAWQWRPNEKLSLTTGVRLRYNMDDYIYIRQKPEVYHNIHETNTISGDVNGSYQLRKGTIGVGFEYRKESIGSNGLGNRSRENTGAYAEYRHRFNDRLNATAGLYFNHNSFYGTQLLPGADVGYRVKDWLRVFGSIGTGQRQPTYTDLYYRGPQNIGNDTLQPEQSIYTEAGLEHTNPYFTVRASYGYRRIKSFIDWARADMSLPWQPQNFGEMNTSIYSVRTSFNIAKIFRSEHVYKMNLNLSYNYLDQHIVAKNDVTTKYNIEALRHQGIATLNALFANHLQLTAAARYQQRISANDYTLIDARVGYKTKQFLFYVDANNILDTQYKEVGSVPLPGRWMSVGVQFGGRF